MDSFSVRSHTPLFILTGFAMIAFAGNSLLCRLALNHTAIDAATFTVIRLLSGAFILGLIGYLRHRQHRETGNWQSAFALFTYAVAFSFAYVQLSAGTGALLLFGAVQITMIGYGTWTGERLSLRQVIGLLMTMAGLVGLLLPGWSAPPLLSSGLMLGAGIAWGVYSLCGRGSDDGIVRTIGNFLLAVPLAIGLGLVIPWMPLDLEGAGYAMASGALASGGGYTIWYIALKGLSATAAATVQLSVPVLAAGGGILFLGEHLTLRLFMTSIAVLGGIALVVLDEY